MKHKSGDKVVIRDYLEPGKVYGKVICNKDGYMEHWFGVTMTIDKVTDKCYSMKEDNAVWLRSDEMFKESTSELDKIIDITNT